MGVVAEGAYSAQRKACRAKNGGNAGSTGIGLWTEVIQSWLLAIRYAPQNCVKATFKKSSFNYQAHLFNVGWQGWKIFGQLAGTMHQSRAIEAVQIQLEPSVSKYFDIYYRIHVKIMDGLAG